MKKTILLFFILASVFVGGYLAAKQKKDSLSVNDKTGLSNARPMGESMDIYKFPTIVKYGNSPKAFVPIGWEIRDTINGNLNDDSMEDIAMVIQSKELLILKDTAVLNGIAVYPKMLIILFAKKNGGLKLSVMANKLFGNNHWGVNGVDAFAHLELTDKVLNVNFSSGADTLEQAVYSFKYMKNSWYLIAAKTKQFWAATSELTSECYYQDINFITGEKETTMKYRDSKEVSSKKGIMKVKSLIKLQNVDDETPIVFAQ